MFFRSSLFVSIQASPGGAVVATAPAGLLGARLRPAELSVVKNQVCLYCFTLRTADGLSRLQAVSACIGWLAGLLAGRIDR